MALTVTGNFKEIVIQRVENDLSFAQALLDETATLFLNGEPEIARMIMAGDCPTSAGSWH